LLRLPTHFSVVPDGGKAPQLIPELVRHMGRSLSLCRMSADPFLDRPTEDAIAATRRSTLVVAGFATEVVVMHAVESAARAGYDVYVPVDACGGMSSRTEDPAFRRIEDAGGVTTSVVGLATALTPDFSKSPEKDAFGILQSLRLA
jgi:nicotinamidase-related amidase